jgi:hypothetical protein
VLGSVRFVLADAEPLTDRWLGEAYVRYLRMMCGPPPLRNGTEALVGHHGIEHIRRAIATPLTRSNKGAPRSLLV